MSATTFSPEVSVTNPSPGQRFAWGVSDALVMLKRNLLHIPRNPELLLDVTISPIMFVLLFRYVFGGAIAVQGTTYVNYLMAGIFVQTLVFATMWSGVFLQHDMQKGLIDRFRSLPITRSAVLTGRTLTDLLRGALAVVIMLIVGILVGFRPEGGLGGWLIGFGLLLLFSFAMTWVGITVAMLVRTPEAVQGALFMGVFPLTFASSAFVPVETMPGWLRAFAENQPLTIIIDALRGYLLGQPNTTDAFLSLAWSVGIIVIFFPLSIWLFMKRTTN
ncbi:MAG: ABC transporter permease [Chloroflexota bacterium]|nr:ABC transporter permease [Chloroflexota bacterium]